MASPGNQHCARCIGTRSFPIQVSCLLTSLPGNQHCARCIGTLSFPIQMSSLLTSLSGNQHCARCIGALSFPIQVSCLLASLPGNQHCARCIGTRSFPVRVSHMLISLHFVARGEYVDYGESPAVVSAREWSRAALNFDNVATSLLTLFTVQTRDNWPEYVQPVVSASKR